MNQRKIIQAVITIEKSLDAIFDELRELKQNPSENNENKVHGIRINAMHLRSNAEEMFNLIEGISPERDYKEDYYDIAYCENCGAKGSPQGLIEAENFIFEIKDIDDEFLIEAGTRGYYIPPIITHHFSGGYGSECFDLTTAFLTREQVNLLPKLICERCLIEKLQGQTIFIESPCYGESLVTRKIPPITQVIP